MTDTAEVLSRTSIAIDMDHVMADTALHLCDWLNARYEMTLTDRSFPSLLDELDGEPRQAMIDYVTDGELMRDLPLMEDCISTISALNDRFCVVICTAAMEFPKTIAPKIDWLERHFPFLDPKLFVFCGHKQVMGTDYLIDDSHKHFDGFDGIPLLYSASHNEEVTAYERVANWTEIADYFAKL